MRTNNRRFDEIRPTEIYPDFIKYADGSALIETGNTRVVTTATIEEKVPPFLKGTNTSWITAEYSMLPRSTNKRTIRERVHGRISGRTQEIQRLIGRALRASTDLTVLGERTIIIDCDVIQADGGTRSASITAGCVSLALALIKLLEQDLLQQMPLKQLVSAISVGIIEGEHFLDLDYKEDPNADIDMNVVKTDTDLIVEVQAAAEKTPFTKKDFDSLLKLADKGMKELFQLQKKILTKKSPLFMAYEG